MQVKKYFEVTDEGIDTFISSPFRKAILTLEELAQSLVKDIIIIEELKEVVFIGDDKIMPDNEVCPLVKKIFRTQTFRCQKGSLLRIVKTVL